MELDAARNGWLSFYENMNGIFQKLIHPDDSTNSTQESTVENLNSLIPSLTSMESNKNEMDGYEMPANLTVDCSSDEDCHKYDLTLSCVGADAFRNGRCMSRECCI